MRKVLAPHPQQARKQPAVDCRGDGRGDRPGGRGVVVRGRGCIEGADGRQRCASVREQDLAQRGRTDGSGPPYDLAPHRAFRWGERDGPHRAAAAGYRRDGTAGGASARGAGAQAGAEWVTVARAFRRAESPGGRSRQRALM
ncbi:hypothetical protein GCM10018793_58540 [Streptomyces sulfonofaciens]|uniref:Uncharacterized protein n=1 Tax=Streptomyces sulfonofaciens TaxID=68272 RepID=A0A919GL83_9ACTN|nr:hypothetical protein GCM10018793_58540 [Streptomyces sulfonofaciens]